MQIKAVIMNHNQPETTDRLAKELSLAFDVSVFDSGSTVNGRAKSTTHSFPNLYWTGCWNEAMRLFQDTDVLWVIGGDMVVKNGADEYRNAIESVYPFGCWSPAIDGRCRPFMHQRNIGNSIYHVHHIEGMCMAVSRDALTAFNPLPEENSIGWGQDVWMCYRSWQTNLRNVVDGRVCMFHPPERGYDEHQAFQMMNDCFQKLIGENWRQEMRYWYDDFDNNVVSVIQPHGRISQVSLIVASFNQRETLELALESYNNQTVLPLEVIIADDGSTDETICWLDTLDSYGFPFVYTTRSHEGYDLVSLNNVAASHAKGSRILFTNGDIIHNPGSVEAHAAEGEDVIAGGIISGINTSGVDRVSKDSIHNFEQIEEISRQYPPAMTNIDYADLDPEQNPYGIWSGNFSVPSQIFRNIGGFNEDYAGKYGGEEADLLMRARQAGCRIRWAKGSIAYHLEHPIREYRARALGNQKFKQEHLCTQ